MRGLAWAALSLVPWGAFDPEQECAILEGFGGCGDADTRTVCAQVYEDGRRVVTRCWASGVYPEALKVGQV